MNRRRRSRGQWIPRLSHDIALGLCGFAYLLALIAIVALLGDIVAMIGDGMGAL